jgi:AAA+ superfamily predicted ATPase
MTAETVETPAQSAEGMGREPYLGGLLPALRRLDSLLERAVAAAQTAYGPEAAADPYRGLHISPEEVARLLAREPGAPTLWGNGADPADLESGAPPEALRLAWLQRAFGLSPFDLDVILIALAPDLDRRYERLYAYLQDHVAHRRPSVDLILNLLCSDAAARLEQRVRFYPDAPLVRHGLIHLQPETDHASPSLLAHTVRLDEQILRFLLDQDGLDARLAPFCRLTVSWDEVKDLPLAPALKRALPAQVGEAWDADRRLVLYFQGPPGGGRRQVAAALAAGVGAPLLVVDLPRALSADLDFAQVTHLMFRAAWFQGAVLYLDGVDSLQQGAQAVRLGQLLDALAADGGVTILAGTEPWQTAHRGPAGVVTVPFALPGFDERRACWASNLEAAEIEFDDTALDTLAGRFRLWPGQIAEAVASAATIRLHDAQPGIPDLFAAARAQSGHDLAALAQKIAPLYTWDDIVLPEDALAQLREICGRVAGRRRVLGEWGFDAKLSGGKGTTALFAGPSGTGKTMAAEVIAGELGLDLFKIDLSTVVSKYIGETEKNLERIFEEAQTSNAILFFDEADALFGKRSEVRDSHDRYANIEVSYLLQKMEAYEGLAILATNMRHHLDEAFIRRLAFTVHFPFPGEASRRRIWEGVWPQVTPLDQDLDLDHLAAQFKLSGGNIRNIALAAAFLAAERDSPVTMGHLTRAVRREYQKMGKSLTDQELRRPDGQEVR